jgi:hypothetical protein
MIPLKRAETIVGRTNENFRRTLFARWEKAMDQDSFVDSLISEIVKPGLHSLMQTQYFSELRQGTLSIRRLQGFSLQHYITNVALNKGFALCMVKYAHDVELYKHFAYQYNEEQYHPDLVKRFGLALFIFECLSHTGAALRGMLAGSPAENRTWALVNESMVCQYCEEFATYLPKHYTVPEDALELGFIGSRIKITRSEQLR